MQKWEFMLPSHAKINLGLYVGQKRHDGYHDIRTIFQELEFHDTLYFSRHQTRFSLTTDHPSLPIGEDNLVGRAVQLLRKTTGWDGHVTIHIQKRIPLGAGLGGGSSNAATTLLGLNHLFQFGLSRKQLIILASELGSDVPFFLYGGTAIGTGRGEKIQPIEDISSSWVLLVNPGIFVSSSWAYKNINLKLTNFDDINNVLPQLKAFVITGSQRFSFSNMLEEPVIQKYPIIESIKSLLVENGAEWAMMSGSGSTVFGIFTRRELAEEALHRMQRSDWLLVVTGTKQRTRIF